MKRPASCSSRSRPVHPAALLLVILLTGLALPVLSQPASAQVPSPTEFFGVRPGTSGVLITWDRLVDYYRTVGERSSRVDFAVVGEATEGSPFVRLLISSPENLSRAEEFRGMLQRLSDPRTLSDPLEKERLVDQGRVVVMVNEGIHATEVGATQAAPNLVYELATSNDPGVRTILDNVIVVMIPSQNPDGATKVIEWWNAQKGERWQTSLPFLYQKYSGHDNNRDWYTFFQQESRLTLEVENAWRPQVVVDQHQMGSGGARIFVPPFEDPYEPNVDPALIGWLSSIGPFMGTYMINRGLTGVEWGTRYDGWSPARAYHHYKGGIRVLTEVASGQWADPVEIPADRLGEDYQRMRWNHPAPWTGGAWTFEDVTAYQHASAKAGILFAANNRRQFLEGFAGYFERSMAYDDSPRGFVIRGDQTNRYEVGELLEILQRAEVEIRIAQRAFVADGMEFGVGSYLVEIRQPFGRFAKALLELQDYPDLRMYPGGPPDLPYDVTAHTLPLLMGIEAVPVDSWTGGDFEVTDRIRPGGVVSRNSGRYLALEAGNTGTTVALNRLRRDGVEAWWAAEPFVSDGSTWPAGTVLIRNNRAGSSALEGMADELALTITSVDPGLPAEHLLPIGRARVGLVQSWFASMDAGWTEWILQHYEFNYTIVRPLDLADGAVLEQLDALIVPAESRRAVVQGRRPGEMPPEYLGGAGEEGLANLRRFVERGGAILSWGGGNDWVAETFSVPLGNALEGLDRQAFFIPGSILRARFDISLPVNYGLKAEDALWFRNDSALLTDVPTQVPLARYAGSDVLMSGWALGTEHIRDHLAAVGIPYGQGAVVLFGFTPQYRAQSRNTMKMLFNTILGAGNPQGAARLLRAR